MTDFSIKDVSRRPARKLRAGSNWMGHRVLFLTEFFGKEYYWLRDIDGTHYLAKVGPDGNPTLI